MDFRLVPSAASADTHNPIADAHTVPGYLMQSGSVVLISKGIVSDFPYLRALTIYNNATFFTVPFLEDVRLQHLNGRAGGDNAAALHRARVGALDRDADLGRSR